MQAVRSAVVALVQQVWWETSVITKFGIDGGQMASPFAS